MKQELANTGFIMPDMTPALPEIFVLTMACVIQVVHLILSHRSRVITYLMSLATLVGAALLTYGMADVRMFFYYLLTAGVCIYSRQFLIERQLFKGEFYTLGLFGVLGMI